MQDPAHTHYEERMAADAGVIRARVDEIIGLVERQVEHAVLALLHGDKELANQVILGDRRINRQIRDIDRLCHAFIVRHAPSAGHLRYVSAVLRLDVALERIGDYAGTISREVVQLSGRPPERVARDIDLISQQARRTLSKALAAFQAGDTDLARETHGLATQTDYTLQKVFAELLEVGESEETNLRDVFGLLRIINLLKRVAEQSENICEQAVFATTGETKDPRIFRILFVDERNDGVSQMAEAYAQKAFPESGTYESAGWAPTSELDPGLAEFMDRNGMNLKGKRPKPLRPIHEELRHWNVVVGLHPDTREHVPEVPFRTVYLEWRLGVDITRLPEDLTEEQMEALLKNIAVRVRDLMQTLRGEDAS